MADERRHEGNEIAKMFIKNDAKTVADNIVYDHILPGFADMIVDGLHSTIDLFFGNGRNRSRSSYTGRGDYVPRTSYNRMYDERDRRGRANDRGREEPVRRYPRNAYRVDDVDFREKDDADEVLDMMIRDIEDHGVVSVAEYYKHCEQVMRNVRFDIDWVTDSWGWESLKGVRVMSYRGNGWVIDLPNPIRI